MWVLGIVVTLLLMIPLLAILLDSDLGRALARRVEPRAPAEPELGKRVEALEEEVEYLSESLRSLQARVREMGANPRG